MLGVGSPNAAPQVTSQLAHQLHTRARLPELWKRQVGKDSVSQDPDREQVSVLLPARGSQAGYPARTSPTSMARHASPVSTPGAATALDRALLRLAGLMDC